jgi:hypothetical protein
MDLRRSQPGALAAHLERSAGLLPQRVAGFPFDFLGDDQAGLAFSPTLVRRHQVARGDLLLVDEDGVFELGFHRRGVGDEVRAE